MESKSIAELVTQTREGSAAARDELVRRHHRQAALLAAIASGPRSTRCRRATASRSVCITSTA